MDLPSKHTPVRRRLPSAKFQPVATFALLALVAFPALSLAQSPPVEPAKAESSIKFDVKSSIDISGTFKKWSANLSYKTPDETTGSLEIIVDATSVDTGSGMKNKTIMGKDFFYAKQNPQITFRSTKFVKTGPKSFDVQGEFTIRGVTNPETLTLAISPAAGGQDEIHGNMIFNRKHYGMRKGIPFVRISDHVEVDILLRGHLTGPGHLSLQQ